ncbi:MAG TPA: flagellar hook-basal body complex protein FliE [Terriglobales bacterium]|jgi:flagellar hook-basal body complex protein FliE|nr:flagellar hook-basal body complex protein FliE [Terriglobales bacterium]
MTNPVSGLAAHSATLPAGESQAAGPREWGFVETLRGAIDEAEQLQGTADAKVSGLLQGNGMDVHSAMIAVEKADLSFQLMMQVRNKIVSAYQEISRMQF